MAAGGPPEDVKILTLQPQLQHQIKPQQSAQGSNFGGTACAEAELAQSSEGKVFGIQPQNVVGPDSSAVGEAEFTAQSAPARLGPTEPLLLRVCRGGPWSG